MKVIREQLIQAAKIYIYGLSFFTIFLRLQIYEAFAAFFWQSASYVLYLVIDYVILQIFQQSYLRKNFYAKLFLSFFYSVAEHLI